MSLTRKDFRDLAEALRYAHPAFDSIYTGTADECKAWLEGATYAWQSSVIAAADFCEKQNPRFDRTKFLDACVPEGRVLGA